MKTLFARLFIALLSVLSRSSYAQGSAGTGAKFEPRYLIDVPSAGIIPHNTFAIDIGLFQQGGLLTTASVGLFDRLVIGVSYGGSGVLGLDSPEWNNSPGYALRIRLVEESLGFPALALGFDSQGKEGYIDRLNRYAIKSMGFYVVGSKNYTAAGYLSFHGGINYSLERGDGDEDLNFFAGAEKTLGPIISLVGEYNLASNDNNHDSPGRGRGYLNLAVRASLGQGFTIGFCLKDILRNQQDRAVGERTMNLEYVQSL